MADTQNATLRIVELRSRFYFVRGSVFIKWADHRLQHKLDEMRDSKSCDLRHEALSQRSSMFETRQPRPHLTHCSRYNQWTQTATDSPLRCTKNRDHLSRSDCLLNSMSLGNKSSIIVNIIIEYVRSSLMTDIHQVFSEDSYSSLSSVTLAYV